MFIRDATTHLAFLLDNKVILTTYAGLVCSSSIYRTFIKTLNELSYYKLALFRNLRELAQVVILSN
jgi:hypothetical protein